LACVGNERVNDRWPTFERLSVDDSPEPRVPVLESRGVGLPAVQPVFEGGLLCQHVAENGMEMIKLGRVVRAHVNHLTEGRLWAGRCGAAGVPFQPGSDVMARTSGR